VESADIGTSAKDQVEVHAISLQMKRFKFLSKKFKVPPAATVEEEQTAKVKPGRYISMAKS